MTDREMTDQERLADLRAKRREKPATIQFLLHRIDVLEQLLAERSVALSVGHPADGIFVYGTAEATEKLQRLLFVVIPPD